MRKDVLNLDSILKLTMPALDPTIIDCTNMDRHEIVQKIYDVIVRLDFRMMEMGIGAEECRRAFVAREDVVNFIDSKLHLSITRVDTVVSNMDNSYILTQRVDGRDIIHPPFYRNKPGYMSWREYFLRVVGDRDPGHIIVTMPYLQAKFIGISL